MIASVDEFILYDDMQFTKNDWRNRNQIKTPQGVQWLSIPVGGCIRRKICEVSLLSNGWQTKHWKTLEANYRRAPHFDEISTWLKPLYQTEIYSHLSQMNHYFIQVICNYLGIKTVIKNSYDYTLIDGKTERLADLCAKAGGTVYLSGPAAKDYVEERIFADKGITLTWFDYAGYPEYPQLWGEFTHGVTILDLLFNCGIDSPRFMKHIAL